MIRISGPDALAVAEGLWKGRARLGRLRPRVLHLGATRTADGDLDAQTLAVFMPAPHTYTGEDTVELHCHGGNLLVRLLLEQVYGAGARAAEPGEFTKRAFLNGRMDLTQAEAVNDLIRAHSELAVRNASLGLRGILADHVRQAMDEVRAVLVEVESRLDFPDEQLDWAPCCELAARLEATRNRLDRLLQHRRQGEILRSGVRVVLAGPPNSGKSSLLNAILGWDRAIVTAIPGTTRDTLEEMAHVRDIPVRLLDTAGIRETSDLVEKSGVERTLDSLGTAHVVLWVFDVSGSDAAPTPPPAPGNAPVIWVGNKRDCVDEVPPAWLSPVPSPLCYTCALTGVGIDHLLDCVEEAVWTRPELGDDAIAVNARQAGLLRTARDEVRLAATPLDSGAWELVAEPLRTALDALAAVLGSRIGSEDILDAIFSKFCIGK